jgi:hypothetical protein
MPIIVSIDANYPPGAGSARQHRCLIVALHALRITIRAMRIYETTQRYAGELSLQHHVPQCLLNDAPSNIGIQSTKKASLIAGRLVAPPSGTYKTSSRHDNSNTICGRRHAMRHAHTSQLISTDCLIPAVAYR